MPKRRKFSLIIQVALLFVAAIVVTAIIANGSLLRGAVLSVREQRESYAAGVADEVKQSIREYPAWKWLLSYWYEHPDTLDAEYDTDFYAGEKTREKIRLLAAHEPSFLIRYADEEQVAALSAEDRKLYAEIVYSWLITRLNEIKKSSDADYLFCVVTNDAFDAQFFLLSAGDGENVRGPDYGEVYPLGVSVSVDEPLQGAMKDAVRNDAHLAEAGDYLDYYSYFEMIDGAPALIGLTFDRGGVREDVLEEVESGILFTMVVMIVLAAISLLLIIIAVLKPVKRIQKGIRRYKETKESDQIAADLGTIRQGNEIGQLSDDVVDLAYEIDEYLEHIRTITEERGRIQSELDLAARIQLSEMPQVFPPFPDRRAFDIFASIDPAKEVGGDFYDFFFTDEDHLAVVIADVSGKGVPAALFMMSSKMILQNCAMIGLSAREIFEKTNEALCSRNAMEMFVTVWIGILEVSTGRLVAANAGHEYPMYRKNGGCFEVLKDSHCPPIGFMENIPYTQYEIRMEPGDEIFVYTDGLAEAADAENNMFGQENILAALNGDPEPGPEKHIESMQKAVDRFVKEAEQFDDLTMLCLRYNGQE